MNERAGTTTQASDLIDVSELVAAYYSLVPDVSIAEQRVVFGTSGHRGSSLDTAFNEVHIAAITQAIVEYRAEQGITGPVFIGRDTHALSQPAETTALDVLAANGVLALKDEFDDFVPTPALSHAIIAYNAADHDVLADGIIITPSHNPPRDGGFKYNPPHGGPADSDATGWIADRANAIIADGNRAVKRLDSADAAAAAGAANTAAGSYDFRGRYVDDLANIIDIDAIRTAGIRIGADPLGGASVNYWKLIAEKYDLDLTVVNPEVDPTWSFMTLDWDGKIRMDCSSADAMAPLIALGDRFDIAFANDTDADRHGIVCPSSGLMNPNAYLAAAIAYLFANRPEWRRDAGIGKTIVSSSMIDRVVAKLGRPLVEVPVGFKWFGPGLSDGSLGFGGEESAGASFLRRDGSVWTTDKDGLIMGLLAAEICARTGSDPGAYYAAQTSEFGTSHYQRIDAPATPAQKALLGKLDAGTVAATELAGEPIEAKLSRAPGNDQPIGGLKVVAKSGWFAARPSGTEDVYKLYAESFVGPEHLARIQVEAQQVIDRALVG